ncbi:MAG TPA: hypothetical protein VHZ95_11560 [Polyangiales bacterium]|nr:hypothetical protein [Polyangiales bacterium]
MTSPKHDPTPVFVRDVLAFYADALSDVRFPDLDLARLEEARASILTTQLEVERIEAKLSIARAALDAELDALHRTAERALAYARVFAQSDPALGARVAELGVRKKPTLADSESTPRKKRVRKQNRDESELFVAAQPERIADA